jgi:phospholipid/cholesterol/gamma-HCH transport system substrate-binding protein
VEIAGVPVGKVESIKLEDPSALVRLRLSNDVKIKDDDILSIRTKGIIGDRYIKISRGGSDTYIEPEGRVTETESVMDIEDLIGKFVHQLSNDDDSKE